MTAEAHTYSDHLFRALIEHSADAIALMASDGTITYASPSTLQVIGYTPEEFIGVNGFTLVHPDDVAQVQAYLLPMMEQPGASKTFEYRFRHKDGSYRWLEATATNLLNDPIIGAIVGNYHDITERKRLEHELAGRVHELETTLEAITDAIFVYDASGNLLRTNAAARQLNPLTTQPEYLAIPLDERIKTFQSRNVSETQSRSEPTAAERVLRGEVLTGKDVIDAAMHTYDGREILLNVSGAPIKDERGTILGGVIVTRDVTERLLFEQARAEQAEQLRTILEAVPDAICVYDQQGRIVQSNESAKKLLGRYTQLAHEPIAVRASQVKPRDLQERLLTTQELPVTRALSGETFTGSDAQDVLVTTFAGEELCLNMGGAPLYDASGQITGALVVIRDVTEPRRATQRTRETLQALLALAEALVQLPLGVEGPARADEPVATEASSVNMVANQLAELIRRLLNCKRVSITTIDPLTGELQASAVVGLEPELEQAWRARQLTLGNIMGDTVAHARMRAGEAVVVDWREPPLVDRANPFGICTMIMAPLLLAHYPEDMPLSKDLGSSADEVPQRSAPGKRLMGILLLDHAGEPYEYSDEEIALTRAVAQLAALTLEQERLLFGRTQARASIMALRETNHLMNEFLGIAGHELRTPLTTVKACVQLAKRQLGRALHQQERLPGEIVNLLVSVQDLQERTERQVGMQNRLVSDLLDVSRIQNDRLELHLQRVNLIALVREAVEDQQFLVPSRPVGLSLAQADDIIVQADADRIRQVISNYLSNALKYSEPDTPVEVYIEGNAATVRVLVQDEGPGLTQQQQQHIWDRFYRVPGIEVKSGSGVGLGLGLHISRIIIERHSGQVGLESTPGQGSTFWFSLPLLPA